MPSVLVALFWIWAIGSAVGYAWFRWNRSKAAAADAFDPMALFGDLSDSDEAPVDQPPSAPQTSVEASTGPALMASPAPVVVEPAAPATAVPAAADDPDQILPAVARALAEQAPAREPVSVAAPAPAATEPGPRLDDLDTLQPAVAAVLRQEQIASGMTGAASIERPVVAVGTMAPLSETLHGISMPAGLAPLSNVGPQESTERYRERLVMMTNGHTALAVAEGLREAMTAIDLEVHMLDDRTVIARRGDRAVEIRIHGEPIDARTDEGQLFPTATDGDIVVEFLAA